MRAAGHIPTAARIGGSMDSNHKQIVALIRSISGQANVLTIPRVFVGLCKGSHRAALLLSQCVYWSDKGDSDGWFFKTRTDWKAEIGMNQHAVTTALRLLPWVQTAVRPVRRTPKTHYRVDLDALARDVAAYLDTERNPINVTERIPINDTERKTINPTSLKTTTQKTTVIKDGAGAPPESEIESELSAAIVRVTNIVGSFGLVKKTARTLRLAGYTAADVDSTYSGDRCPWRLNDWRGKRGDAPTVPQIPLTIGNLVKRSGAGYDGYATQQPSAAPPEPEPPPRQKTKAEGIWDRVLESISREITPSVFQQWFPQTRLVAFDNDTGAFVVSAPTPNMADWLRARMDGAIKRTLAKTTGHKAPRVNYVAQRKG